MASFLPILFSGNSGGGKPYLVNSILANIATATAVHTATSVTDCIDEIWIWAQNNSNAAADLIIAFGGTTQPKDLIQSQIPANSGLFLVVPGLRLNAGSVVKAVSPTINVISVFVNVNRYTV